MYILKFCNLHWPMVFLFDHQLVLVCDTDFPVDYRWLGRMISMVDTLHGEVAPRLSLELDIDKNGNIELLSLEMRKIWDAFWRILIILLKNEWINKYEQVFNVLNLEDLRNYALELSFWYFVLKNLLII